MDTFKITQDDVESLLIYSFRYVLGRSSYAPSQYQDMFSSIFNQFSEERRKFLVELIKRELEDFFRIAGIRRDRNDSSFDNYAVNVWNDFYDKIVKLDKELNQ